MKYGDWVRVREISEIDVHPAGEDGDETRRRDTAPVKELCCLSLRCFHSSRFPDTGPGGGPDDLDDGLVVDCPGPGDERSVIVGGVEPDAAVLRAHQHEWLLVRTEGQTSTA